MLKEHGENTPEHFEIVESTGVSAGIVRQKEPKKYEDEILKSESEPVDVSPGCEFSDDPREHTSDQDSKEKTGYYD